MTDEQPILNIVGELVALGPLRRDLVPDFQRWINDFATVRNLILSPLPMTREQEVSWYEERTKAGDEAFFIIYERSTMRPIGNTCLQPVDHRNRSAEFGIIIGDPDARGKGYGTETTRLMLDYAFTALGLRNVMLTVFEFNPAGIRAYIKAGFREFGRRRECRMMGGKLWDEVYMECLSTGFESPILGRIFSHDPRP